MARRRRSAIGPSAPLGYWLVGAARHANVVTCLEMTRRPTRGFPPPYELMRLRQIGIASYRALFREIGENWMLYSRLIMPNDELRGILAGSGVFEKSRLAR